MALRTTDSLVRAVIEAKDDICLDRFIETANRVTDYVASKDSSSELNSGLLTEIETYLAAHFYHLYDLQVSNESTGGASATYQGNTQDQGLRGSYWGQNAIVLDVTGTLAGMAKGREKGKFLWLGKTVSQKTDFWQRN